MKKAEKLIKTLTKNSGRNVFTTNETKELVEISHLEGIGDIEFLNEKIKSFKSKFVITEWL